MRPLALALALAMSACGTLPVAHSPPKQPTFQSDAHEQTGWRGSDDYIGGREDT